jgi:hypothetical protein
MKIPNAPGYWICTNGHATQVVKVIMRGETPRLTQRGNSYAICESGFEYFGPFISKQKAEEALENRLAQTS